jgi:Ca2+/Na+ antiporter
MPVKESRWCPTFLLCTFFIGFWTFFMVDFGQRFGCVISMPDVIMGLIIMAAGTSVPDTLASVVVAMAGMGDMAVANAVGSNTFNIFLGLGLPWFIWSCIHGEPYVVPVDDLFESVMILIGCLVLYVCILKYCNWWLNRKTGIMFLVLYVATIVYILVRHYTKVGAA